MECFEARGRFLDHREGQLDLVGRMHLEAHLLTCSACRDEQRDVEALLAAVATLPVPEPSPGFVERLRARIEAEKQRGRFPWSRGCRALPRWAPALATLVLVMGAALWTVRPGTIADPPGAKDAARASEEEQEAWGSLLADPGSVQRILQLAPSGTPDWAALAEGRDRPLVALALEDVEVSLEEAVRVWTALSPERRAGAVLAEVAELSVEEVEELLERLGTA